MKSKFAVFVFVIFLSVSYKSISQVCSGTTNIVWQENFGSGTSVLASPSSSITNGYVFANHGIGSGNYSILNYFNFYNSWHTITEDHTPLDTGGYFLVIDGNNSVPVFYSTIINNLCPNTQYSFSTYAMNIDNTQYPSNQTFTFIISDLDGNQLFTWVSPAITVTAIPVWNQFGFNFSSGNNTSLKLQVKFNQTGYDDFAFDDFQFSVCGPTLAIYTTVLPNTCVDSIPLFSSLGSGYSFPVYQWKKKDSAGVFVSIPNAISANYTDTNLTDTNMYMLLVGNGSLSCPIAQTKEIIIKAKERTTINKSICTDSSYWSYTIPGTYIDTFHLANGCDSIRTLNLTVNDCPTPLTLTQFAATAIANKRIQLCWHTEQEIGIVRYNIQRAISGTSDFNTIGSIQSNRDKLNNQYIFFDEQLLPDILYNYRLEIIENTGVIRYSPIKAARITGIHANVVVAPNPTTGIISVQILNSLDVTGVDLFNNVGQLLSTQTYKTGENHIIIDISQRAKGCYWLIIHNKNLQVQKKIMKL